LRRPADFGNLRRLEPQLADAAYLEIIGEWWERCNEPNVLLAHFHDLKVDLEAEMRRVAAFLGIEIPESTWPALIERCTFEGMKSRSAEISDFALRRRCRRVSLQGHQRSLARRAHRR